MLYRPGSYVKLWAYRTRLTSTHSDLDFNCLNLIPAGAHEEAHASPLHTRKPRIREGRDIDMGWSQVITLTRVVSRKRERFVFLFGLVIRLFYSAFYRLLLMAPKKTNKQTNKDHVLNNDNFKTITDAHGSAFRPRTTCRRIITDSQNHTAAGQKCYLPSLGTFGRSGEPLWRTFRTVPRFMVLSWPPS